MSPTLRTVRKLSSFWGYWTNTYKAFDFVLTSIAF